jgi:hypothetical protein
VHVRINHEQVPILVLWQHGTQCAFLSLIKGVLTFIKCPYNAVELSYPVVPESRQFSISNVVADFKAAKQATPTAQYALNHLEEYRNMATAPQSAPNAAPWPASLAAGANVEESTAASPAKGRSRAAKTPAAPAKAAKAPAKAPAAPAKAAKAPAKAANTTPSDGEESGRGRPSPYAGMKIKPLVKNAAATTLRAGSLRAVRLDLVLKCKTADEALALKFDFEEDGETYEYGVDTGNLKGMVNREHIQIV